MKNEALDMLKIGDRVRYIDEDIDYLSPRGTEVLLHGTCGNIFDLPTDFNNFYCWVEFDGKGTLLVPVNSVEKTNKRDLIWEAIRSMS